MKRASMPLKWKSTERVKLPFRALPCRIVSAENHRRMTKQMTRVSRCLAAALVVLALVGCAGSNVIPTANGSGYRVGPAVTGGF